MKKITFKSSLIILIIIFAVSIFAFNGVNESKAEDELAKKLSGKILLQVEKRGEAWYVVPEIGNKRVFLDKPEVAFLTMIQYGVGIRSADLRRIPVSLDHLSGNDSDGDGLPDDFENAYGTDSLNADSDSDGYNDMLEIQNNYDPNFGGAYKLEYDMDFAERNKGRIFIDVEEGGAAWYVNPDNAKRYYLGRPDNAFFIMRSLGMGISNANLEKIPAVSSPSYYANNEYGFNLEMPDTWRNYLVKGQFDDFKYESNNYQAKKITFGLEPKAEDINNDYYNLSEESFTDMLSIYILNNSDYSKLSSKSFSETDYMYNLVKIGSNNYHTFLRDKDIFEESYNNDYIYNRKQEASFYLNKMNIFEVSTRGGIITSDEFARLCKDDLAQAAGGGSIYPVDEKYSHLDNFGELFTASSCSDERVQEMEGVTEDYYYFGSSLQLVDNPSLGLVNTLKDAGYNCKYTRLSDTNCDEWILGEVSPLVKVLDIKPYYNQILNDDCIMCGEYEE
ncbi:MAG: thrombospondin type 3 repeat-containing protein [Patescibacteria group bacterium]|jgi:hypothetical protein|nr:thrombospondin type 3 repeat-containing protein [Patescibacteria group bacterium]